LRMRLLGTAFLTGSGGVGCGGRARILPLRN
jgi:hypothetical protein